MSITDWPAAERPREKLLQHGAAALSDAELLALFLRVGLPGVSAVDLARRLLSHFGSLNALFSASRSAFAELPGMGDAKYAQLQAVQEMARRALGETLRQRDVLTSSDAVRDYLRLWLRRRDIEVFAVLFLDNGHRVLAAEEMAHGTLQEARVYPREIARRALAWNAAAVIVAHNHPSGSAEPSQADVRLTAQLRQALELLEIRLLDHFLVAAHQVVSFAERGLL